MEPVPKQGWIYLPDGTSEEVPIWLLDRERIQWPPTGMSEKRPGEPTEYFMSEDLYKRYEVVEGQAYVFVRGLPEGGPLPDDIRDEILALLEGTNGDA